MEKLSGREYTSYSDAVNARPLLDALLKADSAKSYQDTMSSLGKAFGCILNSKLSTPNKCLIAATAEDADYLAHGIISSLESKHNIKAAIFWNNHYSVGAQSIAPVVHKFLQPGFEHSESLIVVKSILSGSCVVRANIIALVEKVRVNKIFIVSPVVHIKSEELLRAEFPDSISSKFEFIYFAKDMLKEDSGEVIPGIGGQVYQRLGLTDQPVRTGYIPSLVRRLAFAS